MITRCDELGGMKKEKAVYQNCLKKARSLQNFSNPIDEFYMYKWIYRKGN